MSGVDFGWYGNWGTGDVTLPGGLVARSIVFGDVTTPNAEFWGLFFFSQLTGIRLASRNIAQNVNIVTDIPVLIDSGTRRILLPQDVADNITAAAFAMYRSNPDDLLCGELCRYPCGFEYYFFVFWYIGYCPAFFGHREL